MVRPKSFLKVPPAPHVIAQLYAGYKRDTQGLKISFHDYLQVIGFIKKHEPVSGRNEGRQLRLGRKGHGFQSDQAIVLENRSRQGFDSKLPGEGPLVWRVATSQEQANPETPAMLLVQADGTHALETPGDFNSGDAGDPFPGTANVTSLDDTGKISTSFPGQVASVVRLSNIKLDSATGNVTLDVSIQ